MSDSGDSWESPPPYDSAPSPSSNSSNSSSSPIDSSNKLSAASPPSDTEPPETSPQAPPPQEKSTPPPASIPSPPSSSGSPPSPSKQLSPPPASPPTQESSPPPSPPPKKQSPPSPSPSNQPSPPPPPPPFSPPKQQSPPPSNTPNQQSPPPASPPKQQSSPPPPTPPKQQSPPPPRDPSQSPPEKSPPPSSPPPPPPPSPENSQPPPSANPKSTPHGPPPHALAPRAPSPPKSPTNSNVGSPHSEGSGNDKQNQVNDAKNTHYEVVIDVAVAGVFIIAFVALFFFIRRRKKKQTSPYPKYMPPPANFGVKSDAAYYKPHLPGTQSNLANNSESQRGHNYHGPDSGIIAGSKTFFTYEELMEMTNGFARENVIGEGGFGCVYKGQMPDGRFVAVKQLKAGSGQGEREFRAEVEIISRVHHRHLVSLVGYCIAENHRLLIYEFVANKTLEYHLHAKELPVLEWAKRVKIAIGAAKGLAYLHEDCHPRIIHRDIKSANILVEDDFGAQVADFGLARLNDTTQTHVSTRVMGTFGYLAPEYASSGKLTDRSDVYSFGVVLLELITGRKPVDPTQPLGDESLVEWARPLLIQALETGDFGELIDPRLEKRYVESQMFMMIEAAAACVRHSATKRPRMAMVVRALDFDGKSDLSNGVKFGHSTAYDSGQYSEEIMNFRRMALGSSDNSSESDMYSGEYNYTREVVSRTGQPPWKSGYSSGDFTSGDSEINQSFRQNSGEYSVVASGNYGGGGGGRGGGRQFLVKKK